MKLFIWTGFSPDYTGGLAFTIAKDEIDARKQIEDMKRISRKAAARRLARMYRRRRARRKILWNQPMYLWPYGV